MSHEKISLLFTFAITGFSGCSSIICLIVSDSNQRKNICSEKYENIV